MRRLGLGEQGDVVYGHEGPSHVAMVYYRDFSGRRRRIKRSGSSKAAARRAVLKAVASVLTLDGASEVRPSSGFMVGVDGWLATVRTNVEAGKRSPSTLRLYEGTVERCVRDALGELRVGEVTTPRVDRFLQTVLKSKGYATAKACRTVISGACGWLVRQGAMPSNPVRDVSRIDAPRKAARALSASEIREWLALVDGDPSARRRDLPDLCRFMLATGVRIGEALAVTWADVDLDAGSVAVDHTVLRVKGEGLILARPKTDMSNRTLIVPVWAVEMLRARRQRHAVIAGPVFPSARGGWRDASNVLRDLREVRTGSDLAWVKSHTFRKTLATLLDGAGNSARVVADQLGHARISMTQDVYMGRRAVGFAAAEVMKDFGPPAGSDAGQADR